MNAADFRSSAESKIPELTVKSVLLGMALSALLAGANAYLGLFAGMTVSASIPAAVISMAVLRLFRSHTILENNLVQTSASSGEAIAAGVIFTMPALIMIGYWQQFDPWMVLSIATLGGFLGVLFTIPLRRALILPGELKFPEGVATAAVLRAGDKPGGGIWLIAAAALAGAVAKFGEVGAHLWSATVGGGFRAGRALFAAEFNLSPALVSVGYIVGLNIAVLVAAGGMFAWFIAIPIVSALGLAEVDPTATVTAAAGTIWSTQIRYIGVGAMVIGGLYALFSLRQTLTHGLLNGGKWSAQLAANVVRPRTDRDIPGKWVVIGAIAAILPVFLLYWKITGAAGPSLFMTVVMIVAAFLFSAVAAYMAGLVGSSNNPISGVTIATILFSALFLAAVLGREHPAGAASAILVGAVVCCAAAMGGDNLQDLKTGHLVGATPWKQQLVQFIGTAAGAMAAVPALDLLQRAYGFGPRTADHPRALQAPQATLMSSVADGVFRGDLPWPMIITGALIALIVIALDRILAAAGRSFRAPVLAVAVGIYLPLDLSLPILLGGLIAHLASGTATITQEPGGRRGILFASGLITGEALVGILVAIPIVIMGDVNILAVAEQPLGGAPGLAVLALIAAVLFAVGFLDAKKNQKPVQE